jgi:glycosyltransferase involved in cell wall biosynthesis
VNIVHVASSGEMGGAEWVIVDILAGLRVAEPSWHLSLIVPEEGRLARRARTLGVDVVVLRMSPGLARLGDAMTPRAGVGGILLRAFLSAPRIAAYAVRLRRALRICAPDLVHAHGFKMQMLAMWSRPSGVPVVLHLHDYIGQRPLMSRLLRLPLRRPVVAAAISRSVAEDAVRATRGRLPVRVVYNGVDVDHWSPPGRVMDLDALSGLGPPPPGTVRIGLVATFARWKGHETFLRALALLPPATPVRAYIIGGSIYRTDKSQFDRRELEQLASALRVLVPIGFSGFVEEPAEAMRALDVIVHASTRPEPFGRVIIEGMALERAVIVSAAGGAAELIVSGETALSYAPGDAAALGASILTLVDDPALRRRLGVRGRCHVVERFSTRAMVGAIISQYASTQAAN